MNVHGHVKKCHKMSKNAIKCQKMPKNVKNCQKLSKDVQGRPSRLLFCLLHMKCNRCKENNFFITKFICNRRYFRRLLTSSDNYGQLLTTLDRAAATLTVSDETDHSLLVLIEHEEIRRLFLYRRRNISCTTSSTSSNSSTTTPTTMATLRVHFNLFYVLLSLKNFKKFKKSKIVYFFNLNFKITWEENTCIELVKSHTLFILIS